MAVGTPTTNQGNSATPSTAVPTGVASGDIVVLICEFDDSALSLAARWPAGFTSLKDAQGTGDGARYGIAWKRLTAADTGSYTLASGTATLYLMAAIPLTGRHATNAPTISADSIQNTLQNSPVTITALTVTAVAGDDVLFISMPDVHTANGGNGHSGWTAGYTEIVDAEDTTSGFCNIGVAKAESVSAGATGSKTTTFTTAAGQAGWGAWLLTIPAAAGGGVNVTAVTGTATGVGGTTALAFTWTSATGTGTAGGGTVTTARTLIAASGTATAAGTSPGLTVVLTAANGTATAAGPGVSSVLNLDATTGAATAGGGTVNVSIIGGLSLSASAGLATAAGATASLTFTWTAATGTGTAAGGTVTTSRTITATSGTAAASGTTSTVSFTYGAAAGTATAGGGTSTASSSGSGTANVSAVTGTATATGGASSITFTWTAATGTAAATGGTVSRVNPATGGTATASGNNLTLRWVLPVVAGSSTAAGGTVTATSFIPTLGVIDGGSSFSSSVESTGALTGVIG